MQPSTKQLNSPRQLKKIPANDKTFSAYLKNYAEPEAKLAAQLRISNDYHHILVLPAYDEPWFFLETLLPFCQTKQCLLVLVINQPKSIDQCDENLKLWQSIHQTFKQTQRLGHLVLFTNDKNWSFIVVDRFSPAFRIDDKHGVGLARKIGCDIAVTLIANHQIQTSWIHTTDADTQLPNDYFDQTKSLKSNSAALYPFEHSAGESSIDKATQLYQQSINYYVEGLRWAKSPYAFHTIGSCIAVSAFQYCKARGFPKRAGGEDFYLLNKLAKLQPVASLKGEAITIQSRRSNRAPFGTGPAVEKILALPNMDQFCTYDPKVFAELKQLLAQLSQWWSLYTDDDQAWFSGLSDRNQQVCQQLGFSRLFTHLRKQCHTEQDALTHSFQWFDGFRTLKFIHLLQSLYYPPVPLGQALSQARNLFNSGG